MTSEQHASAAAETHEPELWRTSEIDEDGFDLMRHYIPGEVCGTCSRASGAWVPASFCPIARDKL